MATKTKSKSKKPKKAAGKKLAGKKAAPKKAVVKKAAKKQPLKGKRPVAKNASKRRTKKRAAKKQPTRRKQEITLAVAPEARDLGVEKDAGDLQGLSDIAGADSESVDELLEEGNAFEAEVVKGVEDAGANDEREVHTHETPEDDVPEEYLDQD